MRRSRRLGAAAAFVALAATAAAVTVSLARVTTADAEEGVRSAVAGVQATRAAPPAAARRTVVGFLSALRDGDHARACDKILQRRGCEEQLSAAQAGVRSFRVVGTRVTGTRAVVRAVADGAGVRFALQRRGARWWIATLEVER